MIYIYVVRLKVGKLYQKLLHYRNSIQYVYNYKTYMSYQVLTIYWYKRSYLLTQAVASNISTSFIFRAEDIERVYDNICKNMKTNV